MAVLTKEELHELYLIKKKSVRDIAKLKRCSESKINYWLAHYGIQKRTISEAIYLKSNPDGDPFAFREPRSLDEAVLFGLGLGLYWGEGTKRNRTAVRLGNTDPDLIRTFITFLAKVYDVPLRKFRFGLQIFSDMDPEKALSFWCKYLKVPKKQFGKVIVTPARGIGSYREKTRHGVLTIYVSNVKLRNALCEEIEKIRGMPYSAPVTER